MKKDISPCHEVLLKQAKSLIDTWEMRLEANELVENPNEATRKDSMLLYKAISAMQQLIKDLKETP